MFVLYTYVGLETPQSHIYGPYNAPEALKAKETLQERLRVSGEALEPTITILPLEAL